MKCLKLRVRTEDRIADVFTAVKKLEANELLLLCPRQWSVLTDASLLKRLTEENTDKKIIFVISQKFSRDFVSQLGLPAVSSCSEAAVDIPEQTVAEVLTGKVFEIIEPDVPKPEFVSHKLKEVSHWTVRRSQIFFAAIVLILAAVLIAYWLRPRAIISVKPRIEAVPVIQNIILTLPGALPSVINADLPQVSGIFVENNQEGKVQYPTTGREYDIENAHGKVTIFNENPRNKFFVPSRLESPDGLIFRFATEITVPPREGEVPGEREVEIIADPYDSDGNPVGLRGNIAAETELHFAALPPVSRELWYSKANRGPLVGGSTLTHFFVTEEDKILAEEFLQNKFKTDALSQLQIEVANRSTREEKKYVLIDDDRMLQIDFADYVFPSDQIGLELETVGVSGKMRLSGLVFSQDEVEKIVLEKLQSTLDVRQKLLEIDDHSVEYRVLDFSEFEENKWVKLSVKMVGVRTLDFESSSPQNLAWQQQLREELVSKSIDDARALLVNQAEIERVVDIKIFPAWKKALPDTITRIKLQTAFR